jgi:hypothetical protein
MGAQPATLARGSLSRIRKRFEKIFGWLKTVAFRRKIRHRGKGKVTWVFTFAIAARNLLRMKNLLMEKRA